MYRVIIVDDEILVRIGIRTFIPWGYLGLELVGEANNGQEALELIDEFQPQIVITDIRMPQMDGMALIEETVKRKLPVHFIVLSNCEEYEFVRGAMKLGAFDYLLKRSFTQEQLQQVLVELKKKLVMEQVKELPSTKEGDELERDFWKIMAGMGDPGLLGRIGQRFPTRGYTLCCFFVPKRDLGGLHLIFGVIKQMCRNFPGVILFRYMENEILAVIHHTQDQKWIDQFVSSAVSTVKSSASRDCFVFISRVAWDYGDMPRVYEECALCRETWFYRKPPKIVRYEEVKDQFLLDAPDDKVDQITKTMRKAIDLHELDSLEALSEQLFEQYEKKQNTLPKIVKNNYINLVNQCTNVLKNLGFSPAKIDQLFSYTDITDQLDIYELKLWMDDFLKKYIDQVKQALGDGGGRKAVAMAIQYIEDHFGENMKLTDLTGYVNLSVSYFSALFKRTTGIGVIEYLNKTRIKKAKEMFANHRDYSVSEVAYMVGFDNLSYFSKTFKKYEGMTPAEYRKKRGGSMG